MVITLQKAFPQHEIARIAAVPSHSGESSPALQKAFAQHKITGIAGVPSSSGKSSQEGG